VENLPEAFIRILSSEHAAKRAPRAAFGAAIGSGSTDARLAVEVSAPALSPRSGRRPRLLAGRTSRVRSPTGAARSRPTVGWLQGSVSLPLLVARPRVGLSTLLAGWGLQIVGHRVFEKNSPALKNGPVTYQLQVSRELNQYTPQTRTVRSGPLVMIPPVINKFYVTDLAPDRSLIEHLVKSGQQVFATKDRGLRVEREIDHIAVTRFAEVVLIVRHT